MYKVVSGENVKAPLRTLIKSIKISQNEKQIRHVFRKHIHELHYTY